MIGFLAGTLAALAIQSTAGTPSDTRSPQRAIEVVNDEALSPGRVLLAWSRDGLRPGIARALERTEGVTDAISVTAGLDWIVRSRAADGTVLDRYQHGYAVPVEIAVVDPREYARYVAPSERPAILGLEPGEALLSETGAELRGASAGLTIELRDADDVVVEGTISDTAAAGYEIVIGAPTPETWTNRDRFLLMQLGPGADRRTIENRVRALMPAGTAVRIRAEGETPFLRYGDAVLPLGSIKAVFEEFAARDLGNGYLEIDRSWVRRNIKTERVRFLGRVTCHRTLFPQLHEVFRSVAAQGLESVVNREQFGGCYSPRYVDRLPGGRLSHHAFGIGIDVNVAENAFGSVPDQDQRLVRIFEDAGFTWGGRWLVPDGMHFEWVRFP